MSDLLTSASILLALVGVLYALWYPEITASLKTQVPTHAPDRAKPRRQVLAIFLSRALPLSLAAILVAAVYLPTAVVIITVSPSALRADSLAAFLQVYDAIKTAFVLVEILTIGLAIYSVALATRLWLLLRRLGAA